MNRDCERCPIYMEAVEMCTFPLMKPRHDEFCEGIAAQGKGKTRDDCPYPDGEEKLCGGIYTRKSQWYGGFTYGEQQKESAI